MLSFSTPTFFLCLRKCPRDSLGLGNQIGGNREPDREPDRLQMDIPTADEVASTYACLPEPRNNTAGCCICCNDDCSDCRGSGCTACTRDVCSGGAVCTTPPPPLPPPPASPPPTPPGTIDVLDGDTAETDVEVVRVTSLESTDLKVQRRAACARENERRIRR